MAGVKEKFYRFMMGRYGGDKFNQFLMIAALILIVLAMFGVPVVNALGLLCLLYAYFRMFSRNIYKRQAENAKYMKYPSIYSMEMCLRRHMCINNKF